MKLQNHGVLLLILVLFTGFILFAGCTGEQSEAAQKGKIIGIEPGAGIMQKTEDAIRNYGLDYTLVSSSSAGMASELTKAVNSGKWVVVTGWSPHWKFARFDLKYLDDPKGIFGGEENICALTRTGFEEDNPGAYDILTRFNWSPEEMASVMLATEEGKKPEVAAEEYLTAHPEQLSSWIGSVSGDGSLITLGYVLWDSEIASTNVLKLVFEKAGYKVKMVAVDAGPLYQAVSTGDVDCTISAWLPITHSTYMEKYGDDLVNAGTILTGAKIGLVVPDYVTISSIEELNSVKDKFQ
ncbi:glycine betaine ABC transporter substrate-binding protein [Methanospirillum sp.]|uniref:glycine betaine ABC transporter substrate-binding protein n=1 Tax=Methanospirillum sp. TaxID=45200 RepID=UPI00359F902A